MPTVQPRRWTFWPQPITCIIIIICTGVVLEYVFEATYSDFAQEE